MRTSLAIGYQGIADDDIPTYTTMLSGSLLYDPIDDSDAAFLPPVIIQSKGRINYLHPRRISQERAGPQIDARGFPPTQPDDPDDTPKPRFSAQFQYPSDDPSYCILPGDLFNLGEDIVSSYH